MPALPDAQFEDLYAIAESSRRAADASGHVPLVPMVLLWGDADSGGHLRYVCHPSLHGSPFDAFMRIMGLAVVARAEAISLVLEIAVMQDPPEPLPDGPVLASDYPEFEAAAEHRLAVLHVEPNSERECLAIIPIGRDDDGSLSFGEPDRGELPLEFPFVAEMYGAMKLASDPDEDPGFTAPETVELLRGSGDAVAVIPPK